MAESAAFSNDSFNTIVSRFDCTKPKAAALRRVLPDPYNLTPRTQYAIELLGLKFQEYNHLNSKYFTFKDSNEQTKRKNKPKKDDPNYIIDEYFFWRNLAKNLKKIRKKRKEIIKKHMTLHEIEAREGEMEESVIQQFISTNKHEIEQTKSMHEHEIQRYRMDIDKKIEEQKRNVMKWKMELKKKAEMEQRLKRRDKQIQENRRNDEVQVLNSVQFKHKQRSRQMLKSLNWHMNQDAERTKRKKLKIKQQASKRFNYGIDLKTPKEEKLHLKHEITQFHQTQKKRQLWYNKYNDMTMRQRELLRTKSEYFKSKNKKRAQTAKKNLHKSETMRIKKIQNFEKKLVATQQRLENMKQTRKEKMENNKNDHEMRRQYVQQMAKDKLDNQIKDLVKKFDATEKRRKELALEKQRVREIKNVIYNHARNNAFEENEHAIKSRDRKNQRLSDKFARQDQMQQRNKVLQTVISQQRMRRTDLHSKIDAEYRDKIDTALHNNNIEQIDTLFKEYELASKEIDVDAVQTAKRGKLEQNVHKKMMAENGY